MALLVLKAADPWFRERSKACSHICQNATRDQMVLEFNVLTSKSPEDRTVPQTLLKERIHRWIYAWKRSKNMKKVESEDFRLRLWERSDDTQEPPEEERDQQICGSGLTFGNPASSFTETHIFHVVLDAVLVEVGRCLSSVEPLGGVHVCLLKVVSVDLQLVFRVGAQVYCSEKIKRNLNHQLWEKLAEKRSPSFSP